MALVTKQSVFEAADTMKSQGKKPTLESIRTALGGGSPNPICEHLKAWRAAESINQTVAPITEPVPASLQERFGAVLASAWSDALALANERLESERRALASIRETLEADAAEAMTLAESVTTELEAAQTQIKQLSDAASAAAKTHVDQLAATVADNGQLRTMLDQVTADHQATIAAKAELSLVIEAAGIKQRDTEAHVSKLAGELATSKTKEAAAVERQERAEKNVDQELRKLLAQRARKPAAARPPRMQPRPQSRLLT